MKKTLLPLQGADTIHQVTQGVALGYVLAAPSGRSYAVRISVHGRAESPMVSIALTTAE